MFRILVPDRSYGLTSLFLQLPLSSSQLLLLCLSFASIAAKVLQRYIVWLAEKPFLNIHRLACSNIYVITEHSDRGEYFSKKSETVYRPIWGILKLSGELNQKILKLSFWGIPHDPKRQANGFLFTPASQNKLRLLVQSPSTKHLHFCILYKLQTSYVEGTLYAWL